MAVFGCTVADAKTMRQNAKYMARQLRLMAKQLDRRGVELYEGTLEFLREPCEAWPEAGYRRFEPSGFTRVTLKMRYLSPEQRKKAEDEAAG